MVNFRIKVLLFNMNARVAITLTSAIAGYGIVDFVRLLNKYKKNMNK
jgi:hypothetical protein